MIEVEHLLPFFEYEHLPAHLQAVSRPVRNLAHCMVATVPPGDELAMGLRKLLEAKDCFVRAALVKSENDLARTRAGRGAGQ